MADDEAHADVAQAGSAEVVAGVQKRRRVLRGDALLYSQLAQTLAIAVGVEQSTNSTQDEKGEKTTTRPETNKFRRFGWSTRYSHRVKAKQGHKYKHPETIKFRGFDWSNNTARVREKHGIITRPKQAR